MVGFGDGLVAGAGIGWFWPALLGLAGLGLVGAVIAADNRDDGNDHGGADGGDGGGNVPGDRPATPTLESVIDDVGDQVGPIENGGITDDNTPTFTGIGTPGNTVIVRDGDTVIGEVVVGEDGKWSYTPEPPLAEGPHEIILVEKDPSGNQSEPSDGFELIIDLTAPGQAQITSVVDDQGAETGTITSGDTTDDALPQISGTAEPGSTVVVYDNGVEIGRAVVDADGNWSFSPELPLGNGAHQLTVTAVDAAGNVGLPSAPFDFTVDAGGVAPAPAITGVTDDVGTRTGNVMPGGITDDARPTITGTGQAGSTIRVYADGVLLGETQVGADGHWAFTPESDLSDGLNNISATATDTAGNVSPQTGDYPLTIDTSAPDAASGETLNDNVGAITGPIASGDTTDDSTPTFAGKGEPGATAVIYDNGVEIGRVPVDANGDWSFTPATPLVDGAHSFHSVIEDAAGNQGDAGSAINFIVDTQDVLISITQVTETPSLEGPQHRGGDYNPVPRGGVTSDATPTIAGKATPNSTVNIYDKGVLLGSVQSDASGDWVFTPENGLAEGQHDFTATVVTEAGGESAPTAVFNLEIDTTAPGKPGEGGNGGIDDVHDDVGDIQGPISNGGATDDTTPTLSGGGQQPGDKVSIIDNGQVIGEVVVGDDGKWTFTPNPPLNDGKHDFTLVVTDPAGNASEASDPYTVIVDTTAPGQPVITSVVDDQGDRQGPIAAGEVTDDAMPQVNGTAEAGSIVIIYDNGVEIGRAPVDADGNWHFTPTLPLANGGHSVSVVAVDTAGNQSPSSEPFDFDLLAGGIPPAPAITEVLDDVGVNTGNLMPGSVTDDARPTINGTAQPGSTIQVYSNGELLGETVVGEDGRWSFTPQTDLADGLNNISATATDAAGNVSPQTGDYPLTIDTGAPGAATDETLSDDVGAITGPIVSGDVTDDNTPTLNGKAEPGSTVIVYDNGQEIGRAPVDANGDWSFTPSEPLNDGQHSFNTVVQDPAGNQSEPDQPIDFTVDTRAVEISITTVVDDQGSIIGALSNGAVSDDTTPTLNGKGTPNSVVNIYDNGVLLGSANTNGSGDWTFTPALTLAEGDYAFTATVVTEAGGESAPTAEFRLQIDTTAPGKPGEGGNGGIDEVYDDVGDIQGPISNGGSTDDTTPTLSGGGQQPGDKVSIIDNGQVIGEVVVGDDGNWTFTPNPPLNDGQHDFTLIVTDPAGNASEESDPYTVIVDTTAPTVLASITSVGKDSGLDSGDFLTNDGSAGRLIQGTLNAALAAGEKVQVSVDGGATWQDALLNADGSWSFVDETAHVSDWRVQARVIDASGNVGPESSQDISLDTTAPNPPESIGWSDGQLTVGFDASALSLGDSIHVVVDGKVVQHPLTQAEIDAGSATFAGPVGVSGNPQVIEAALVDAAGNVSDYRSISYGSSTITENFDNIRYASLSTNQSAKYENFTFTGLAHNHKYSQDVGSNYPAGADGQVADRAPTNALQIAGTVKMDLVAPASTFSATVGDRTNGGYLHLDFWDSAGNHIMAAYSKASDGLRGNISVEMPEGVYFQAVTFTVITDDYVWVDNMVIGSEGYVDNGVSPPDVLQSVMEETMYLGGDEANVFDLADVTLLDSSSTSIHGNAGLDTLRLVGQDQVLDLTDIGDRISSIEVIDLIGTGDNHLDISLDDVLNNGGVDLFHDSGKTQMMINGDAGDVVDLEGLVSAEDPGNWSAIGAVEVGGKTYEVYSHSSLDAELLVQQGVTTNLV
nr:Ig-like domain-containing protein [Pseudomonas sp. BW16M2]